ncbi:hypothetical protein QN277_019517 [Acacia crassicarpa]|uniref:C-JID domain-containing protein n=1 Tax=Acacia crassicarpa TaxID=499986 RepID=A0AAE1MR26_9FABA|nr:hypothetical protein QN277_019517 [Acacia crassicarpa]
MHDLIQSMAFKIVRQQCKNPEGRSRLWNPDEIYDVLKRNLGTNAIEGICLDLSRIGDLQLSVDAFRKMGKLRFLKFYSLWHKRLGVVNLPSGLESFSNSLSYLRWDNFPSNTLPLPFCAEKLVELHMPNSHLEKLWDGVQNLVNLRTINLRQSKQLIELPDFCTAQNLERINLFACGSLCHIDPSILSLPRLSYLELSSCKKLQSLKMESQSKSLSSIHIIGCSSLKEFSFSSAKINCLQVRYTGVEILDFSIGHMEKLQTLELNCAPLKILPINEICCMRSLQQLFLDYCGGIIDKSKLYTLFDALLFLRIVSVRGACRLTELPNNVKHLSRLQCLRVSICKSLQSIPELPPSIEQLQAFKCSSLKTLQLTSHIESSLLPDEIKLGSTLCFPVNYLINLRELILGGCEQLYELPQLANSLSSLSSLDLKGSNVEILPCSLKHLLKLKYIYLSNCRRLRSLPELPPFIEHVDANGCISLEILSPSITSAPKLMFLFLNDCLKLENSSLSCVMESAYFSLKQSVYTKRGGAVCFPGRNVPKWFSFNQGIEASNYITIELPATTNNLVGFIFCSVLSHHPPGDLQCQLYYDGKARTCSEFRMTMNNLDSHNVFLWCDPDTFINFHKATDGHNMNYRPKVSFEFFVSKHREKFVDCVIEACGVCPIYASEYNNFIQQMELLDSNLGGQKETSQNVDENSFHGILKNVSVSLKRGKWGNFEGSIIPEWFTYRSSTINYAELQVSVRLTPNFDNLKGFMFCFVIPYFSSKERDQCHSTCKCIFYDRNDSLRGRDLSFFWEGTGWPLSGWHYSMVKLNSDNVFLWYDPLYCESILENVQKRLLGDDAEPELQFGFKFGHGLMGDYEFELSLGLSDGFKADNCLIKECGVRPIYDSEYTNFLQQHKLKVSISTKRHRNIDDDQHQLPSTKKLKESSIIQSIPLISWSDTSHDVNELQLMLSELKLEPRKNHIHQD